MAFCICKPFSCESEGLISVSIQGSSSSRLIPGTNTVIGAAATGNINIVGYAFNKGEDKWLGVRCPSSAQGNQTHQVRYNGCDDNYVIIPSSINTAVLVGDDMDGVTFSQYTNCGTIVGETAGLQNGVTVVQETVTRFGHSLSFKDFELGDTQAKKVFGAEPAYLQSLTITSSFPQPATFSVSYQFIVECSGNVSTGSGGSRGGSTGEPFAPL